jgi:hypothetical protein
MLHLQQNPPLACQFVELFFDSENGFNIKRPLSVIEGMVVHPHRAAPFRIDHGIRIELKNRGYKVWATRACRRSTI